ncbi:MAG: DUF362 domain-containing protein [Planctomycetota bacterium]
MRTVTRREVLAHGAVTAGCLAAGAVGIRSAAHAAAPALPPDKSADAPSSPVALERCENYEPQAFRAVLERCLNLIGGVKPLVENKTVTIKINLTGMTWDPVFGLPAQETYQTQPDSLAALCAILADAGARRIIVIENLYWKKPVEQTLLENGWDVNAIKAAGNHRVSFEDTRNRGAFPGYSRITVPWGGFVYPAFDVNQRFEKTDVLVSLTKLKQHATAGITGVIKNFFGNTPSSIYGDDGPGEDALMHRARMFHGGRSKPPAGAPAELDHGLPLTGTVRVPRITADIYGARPADLGIVDGVRTIRGGEGHWNRNIGLMEPKVLLAGLNGVCTDAVCTAVMGFDPQADHGQKPFQGDNHLKLLAEVGHGTNDLARIEVRGVAIKDVVCPFDAATRAPQERS